MIEARKGDRTRLTDLQHIKYHSGDPEWYFSFILKVNMLLNFFYILRIYISMAFRLFIVNKRNTKKLIKELNGIFSKIGKKLSAEQEKRIEVYTAICYCINLWFSTLRGYKPTSKERTNALYGAAFTSLIDELTDSEKISSQQFFSDLESADNCYTNELILVKYLHTKLFTKASAEFIQSYKHALIIHDQSIEQIGTPKLDERKLKQITYNKGSSTTLVCRMALENPMKTDEKEAVLTLGYLLQLLNDMFDIYKDYNAGQQTLFTNTSDIHLTCLEFEKTYSLFQSQIKTLNYNRDAICKCLAFVSTIISRGKVCIEKLKATQATTGNVFELPNYSRKQLVCDMDSPSSIVKSIKYSVAELHSCSKLCKFNQHFL